MRELPWRGFRTANGFKHYVMQRTPKEIRRVENTALQIRWSDDALSILPAKLLRTGCPCASCKNARGDGASHERPLTAQKKPSLLRVVEASLATELRLEKIYGVGTYAIGIRWGDGHETGIYTYQYLDELAVQADKFTADKPSVNQATT
jgi:DUF971 family protein